MEIINLVSACQDGNLEAIDSYFSSNAYINDIESLRCEKGAHLLHWAAVNGHIEICKRIVDIGVHPGIVGGSLEETPLMWAVKRNQIDVVKYFCNYVTENSSSCDLDAKSNNGFTALHLACFSSNFAICYMLLHAGADPNIPANDGDSCLMILLKTGGSVNCARLLMANNANALYEHPISGNTIMHDFCERVRGGSPENAIHLYSKGGDGLLNMVNNSMQTPAELAATSRNRFASKLMMELRYYSKLPWYSHVIIGFTRLPSFILAIHYLGYIWGFVIAFFCFAVQNTLRPPVGKGIHEFGSLLGFLATALYFWFIVIAPQVSFMLTMLFLTAMGGSIYYMNLVREIGPGYVRAGTRDCGHDLTFGDDSNDKGNGKVSSRSKGGEYADDGAKSIESEPLINGSINGGTSTLNTTTPSSSLNESDMGLVNIEIGMDTLALAETEWPGVSVTALKEGLICASCELDLRANNVIHCQRCDACVKDMDHHNLFLNTCIGRNNRRVFFSWLLASGAAAFILWSACLWIENNVHCSDSTGWFGGLFAVQECMTSKPKYRALTLITWISTIVVMMCCGFIASQIVFVYAKTTTTLVQSGDFDPYEKIPVNVAFTRAWKFILNGEYEVIYGGRDPLHPNERAKKRAEKLQELEEERTGVIDNILREEPMHSDSMLPSKEAVSGCGHDHSRDHGHIPGEKKSCCNRHDPPPKIDIEEGSIAMERS